MINHRKNLFFAGVAITVSSIAHADDYGTMLQQQLQQDQALSNQMQQMENNIVQQNMQNPQIQGMYQQYLASGGTMSFEQFAYSYAATGGFTPEGTARYRQSEQLNQQNEQNALQRYRGAQDERAQAMQEMFNRQGEIAHHRGNLLDGTTDYTDPSNGAQYNLPYTVQPDSTYYDQNTQQNFYNDPQGNYYRLGADGYQYPLKENQ